MQTLLQTRTLILAIFAVSLLSACGPSRSDLESQAVAIISKEVVAVTNTCFDQLTLGLGGLVSDLVLTKKEKDSLILHPITPYIKDELKKKNETELSEIIKSRRERMKFILMAFNNNRENIAAYAGEKVAFAKEIISAISTLIEKYANQEGK